ncbi:MAG: DUF3048 domain-containing protein [Anaerolineales bacterium]|nr:MAG: DUF3048 domain-containing protein [Anaerolineales bacterium]
MKRWIRSGAVIQILILASLAVSACVPAPSAAGAVQEAAYDTQAVEVKPSAVPAKEEPVQMDPPDGPPPPTATSLPPTEAPFEEPPLTSVNPFTGLVVDDPDSLTLRPILVSISNFPPSARPQSGLSHAAHVFSTFIGFGMNRFLALVYAEDLIHLGEIFNNRLAEGVGSEYALGPVRSGRVAFEDIKNLYPHAALITAGASPEVLAQLSNQTSVYGSNEEDINSTGVSADRLSQLAKSAVIDPAQYLSLVFDPRPPAGGSDAEFLRVIYNYLNQNGWQYDAESGRYIRLQDKADGSGELFIMTDALTDQPLGFENVVVLWAQHTYVSPTVVEINLSYVWDHFGLLYRDGQVYEIQWATRNGKLTLYDSEGNPVPLKPGHTWFEVMSYQSTWDRDKSIVRFHEPPSDF